jgi:molecular chaperone GrpE
MATKKKPESKKKPDSSKKKSEGGKRKKAEAPSKQAAAESPDVLNERLLRLQADFDNFRKRTLRERDELYRRANEDLMEALLDVLDHLDLALKSAEEHNESGAVVDGFKLVAGQMADTLGKFGLKPIDTAGEEFDPHLHEAVSHLPSDDVAENGVMAEVRRGYLLGERLLRAARVVVSSGAAEE